MVGDDELGEDVCEFVGVGFEDELLVIVGVEVVEVEVFCEFGEVEVYDVE